MLSITSIIAALSIPKAIMNYKVQSDLKMNIKSMQENVNRFRNKIQNESNEYINKSTLIYNLNTIDSLLINYIQYCKHKSKVRFKKAHKQYEKLIEPIDDSKQNNRTDIVRLLDDYYSLLSFLCIELDVNTIVIHNENTNGDNQK